MSNSLRFNLPLKSVFAQATEKLSGYKRYFWACMLFFIVIEESLVFIIKQIGNAYAASIIPNKAVLLHELPAMLHQQLSQISLVNSRLHFILAILILPMTAGFYLQAIRWLTAAKVTALTPFTCYRWRYFWRFPVALLIQAIAITIPSAIILVLTILLAGKQHALLPVIITAGLFALVLVPSIYFTIIGIADKKANPFIIAIEGFIATIRNFIKILPVTLLLLLGIALSAFISFSSALLMGTGLVPRLLPSIPSTLFWGLIVANIILIPIVIWLLPWIKLVFARTYLAIFEQK